MKKYTREDIWKNPEKKFISDEVIIISIECKDSKWNTDGGFGKYEIYDFVMKVYYVGITQDLRLK